MRAARKPARLGSNFGTQFAVRAASPHRLEAAFMLKAWCGLQKQLRSFDVALVLKTRCGLPVRTTWKRLCAKPSAGCQPSPVKLEAALVLKAWCGLPAYTAQVLQKPARAASPHRLELKGRRGLPARTAWCASACACTSEVFHFMSLHESFWEPVLRHKTQN